MVGCGIWLTHQFSGISSVVYYLATIIRMGGVIDKQKVLWISLAPAGISLISSLFAVLLVGKVGRRNLTLISLCGVIIALMIIAAGFQLSDQNTLIEDFNVTAESAFLTSKSCKTDDAHKQTLVFCSSKFSWSIPIGLILYLGFFDIGLAPMPWVINSEIYPLWAKSMCQSTAMTVNWLSNFFITISFLPLSSTLSNYGIFYLYAAIAFISFVFLICFLPETKGITLEDDEKLLHSNLKKSLHVFPDDLALRIAESQI